MAVALVAELLVDVDSLDVRVQRLQHLRDELLHLGRAQRQTDAVSQQLLELARGEVARAVDVGAAEHVLRGALGAVERLDDGLQRHLHHLRVAVALAAVNVFGGFLVARRMLEMFKKKDRSAAKAEGK